MLAAVAVPGHLVSMVVVEGRGGAAPAFYPELPMQSASDQPHEPATLQPAPSGHSQQSLAQQPAPLNRHTAEPLPLKLLPPPPPLSQGVQQIPPALPQATVPKPPVGNAQQPPTLALDVVMMECERVLTQMQAQLPKSSESGSSSIAVSMADTHNAAAAQPLPISPQAADAGIDDTDDYDKLEAMPLWRSGMASVSHPSEAEVAAALLDPPLRAVGEPSPLRTQWPEGSRVQPAVPVTAKREETDDTRRAAYLRQQQEQQQHAGTIVAGDSGMASGGFPAHEAAAAPRGAHASGPAKPDVFRKPEALPPPPPASDDPQVRDRNYSANRGPRSAQHPVRDLGSGRHDGRGRDAVRHRHLSSRSRSPISCRPSRSPTRDRSHRHSSHARSRSRERSHCHNRSRSRSRDSRHRDGSRHGRSLLHQRLTEHRSRTGEPERDGQVRAPIHSESPGGRRNEGSILRDGGPSIEAATAPTAGRNDGSGTDAGDRLHVAKGCADHGDASHDAPYHVVCKTEPLDRLASGGGGGGPQQMGATACARPEDLNRSTEQHQQHQLQWGYGSDDQRPGHASDGVRAATGPSSDGAANVFPPSPKIGGPVGMVAYPEGKGCSD